jgi:hypothetical protein
MKFGSSFYRNDLSGLGADDSALSFADQALIGIVSPQPSLIYTEWALQTGDASWQEVTPSKDYQAYAVSDFQLVAVANTTSSEVSTLAAISPVLTRASVVKTAFEGTPFAYDHTEAVYAQLDTQATPQIYYVYWLKLRDPTDPKTGPTSLNYAATTILGVLAYILQIPPAGTDRAHPPTGSFPNAFAAQAGKAPVTIPATPAVQTTIPAVPGVSVTAPTTALPSVPTLPASSAQQASMASASQSNLKALLWVGLGTVVVVGGYKYYQSKRRAS